MKCTIKKGVSVYDTTWKRDGSGKRVEKEGYYVTIPNEMGTTTSFVEHLSEAFSLVGKFDNEYDAIVKRKESIGEYMKNNPWAYQDSFDNNVK